MADNQNNQSAANDGSNTPRPENQHGVGAQQQGQKQQTGADTTDNDGNHGGNRGGNQDSNPGGAKGSSNRGDQPSADQRNQGGGQDNEKANQTKNTTSDKSDYGTGNAAPSAANDGGTIDDENNS
ncbi:hypothetical protein ACW9KT_06230 [Hymenobacter sp. HD11105]|jgi:hypothetical protein